MKIDVKKTKMTLDRMKLINMILEAKSSDPDGTRTHNLPVRSRTRYPLRHEASAFVYPAFQLKC